jgi:WD40 repeat protein
MLACAADTGLGRDPIIAQIEEMGGKVELDQTAPEPSVVLVDLSGTGVTNKDLEHLDELTDLQSLDLDETQISDAGLVHLRGLVGLRALSLRRTLVTDTGAVDLQRVLTNTDVQHTRLDPLAVLPREREIPMGGREARRFVGHKDIVWGVAFSPDGQQLVSAGGGNAKGDVTGTLQWFRGSDFAPRLWDTGTGRELRRFEGHTEQVPCVAISSDGRFLVSASADRTIRLWDVSSGKALRQLEGHSAGVWSAVFSSDGARVLSGGRDGTVRLWDVASGNELKRFAGHTRRVWAVALSPDGSLAASSGDDPSIRLWDVETGRQLRSLRGHTNSVVALAFSANGRRLLSGGWDNTVRLWDVKTGEQLQRLAGHEGRVEGVALGADGRFALSGSLDKTVRLWDVPSGLEVCCLRGHMAPVSKVAFSPDGRHVLSGSWDKTVRLWRIPHPDSCTFDDDERADSRYVVPAGSVSGLLAFVERLRDFRPQSFGQYSRHRLKAPNALREAATRILRFEEDEWSKAYQLALLVLLEDRVRAIPSASDSARRETLAHVKTFLRAKEEMGVTLQDAQLALSTSKALEDAGNDPLAAEAYRDLAELIGSDGAREVLQIVTTMEAAARRLSQTENE